MTPHYKKKNAEMGKYQILAKIEIVILNGHYNKKQRYLGGIHI